MGMFSWLRNVESDHGKIRERVKDLEAELTALPDPTPVALVPVVEPRPMLLSEPVITIIRSMKDFPEDWEQKYVSGYMSKKYEMTHKKFSHLKIAFNYVVSSMYKQGEFMAMVDWMTDDERRAVREASENWQAGADTRRLLEQKEEFMVLIDHYGQLELQLG